MLTTAALTAAVNDMDKASARSFLDSDEYYEELDRLIVQWNEWLVAEHGMADLPEEVQDKVFALAYENGHVEGYEEVARYYKDFAEVAVLSAS